MVCKTFIAGSIPAVASEANEFANSRLTGQGSNKTLVVCWLGSPRKFRNLGKGLSPGGKGLRGKGLRVQRLVPIREARWRSSTRALIPGPTYEWVITRTPAGAVWMRSSRSHSRRLEMRSTASARHGECQSIAVRGDLRTFGRKRRGRRSYLTLRRRARALPPLESRVDRDADTTVWLY